MILALISLTTPLLLSGLALLALPLIAHWLHRRSRRTIVFPSIALLVQTAAQQSKFHRLKRWMLLMLRLWATACIVLAFTRPVWVAGQTGQRLPDDAAAAVVLIVDVSASTAQRLGGMAELEVLKAQAGRVLDDLREGVDLAGVVAADAAPHAVFPRLTANLAGLRGELGRLAPSAERADIPAAIAVASRLLTAHAGHKRLVILSDLQRSNWSDVTTRGRVGEDLPPETTVMVLPRVGEPPPNLALSRPQHFPPFPLRGEPFDLTVMVKNHSDLPQQALLRCERQRGDGSQASLGFEELTLTLEPREERPASFRFTALETDRQFVRFELLGQDALAIDNTAWDVVQPATRIPVIVLSDDDPRQPGTTAYYLTRALAPEEGRGSRFQPRHVRPQALTPENLAAAPLVAAGYLGMLPADCAERLAAFLDGGGGLLLFAGEGPVDRNLTMLETASRAGGLLPWQPGPRRTPLGSREPWRITGGRWQSRWLRAFDEQSQLAVAEIPFRQTWSAGALAPETDVLLRFQDGSPALGVRAVGRGMLLVANFSPEPTTSDLARHGAFVALTQMLLQGMLAEAVPLHQPTVGGAYTWPDRFPPGSDEDLSAVGPSGDRVPLSSRLVNDALVVTIPEATRPGLYQLRRGGATVDAVAIAIDERESDLSRLPAAEVQRAFASAGLSVASPTSAEETIPPLRGRPLWGECFAAALAAIALELLLLGWWRR